MTHLGMDQRPSISITSRAVQLQGSTSVQSPTRIGDGNNFIALVGGFVIQYAKTGDLFISAGYVIALGAGNNKKVWCETQQTTYGSARADKLSPYFWTAWKLSCPMASLHLQKNFGREGQFESE
jgi:hypothetical protein